MPKKRWSAHDERKYNGIVSSCRKARGRKKGVSKICKRIAAATVERDRGLEQLGIRRPSGPYMDARILRDIKSSSLGAIPARGMGAQLLSVNLGGRWQAGDRVLKSRAMFQQKGDRTAIISNAEDPDWDPYEGEASLGIYEGRVLDGDDLRPIEDERYPDAEAAKAGARRHGFDGLRGCACADAPSGLGGRKRKRRK